MSGKVRVRFAPSPTGDLHIGGARTALFNWIFAKQNKGDFLLRIEDTNAEKNRSDMVQSILDGLAWLGLEWDEPLVYQSHNKARHQEVAYELLANGKAYYCDCPIDAEDKTKCSCRDAGKRQGAVRFKRPLQGKTFFQDVVYGRVEVGNELLDDMVILRTNGAPTYMLSVVVDDFDMSITHVVRGVDHLTNTLRQMLIIEAMGWPLPTFVHLPLIHGADGKKLSKRHGAVGLFEYRDQGFLPNALENALMRMGWGHADTEFVTKQEVLSFFSWDDVGKSKANFDIKKLYHYNQHYMVSMLAQDLLKAVQPFLQGALTQESTQQALLLIPEVVKRCKTLKEVAESLQILWAPETFIEDVSSEVIQDIKSVLATCQMWNSPTLEEAFRHFCDQKSCKLVHIAQPLRILLTGKKVSPPVFLIMEILGQESVASRIDFYEKKTRQP